MKKTMKKSITFALFFLLCIVRLSAQSNTGTVGGEATGSGGTSSFTAGEVFYTFKSAASGSSTDGVQQSYLVRPTGVISGDATLCVGTGTQLSIALTGQGPWFGTLSDGTPFSGIDNPLLVTVTPTATTNYTIATLASETATASAADLTGSANVIVNQPIAETTVVAVCGNYLWAVNGQTYTESGTYIETSENAFGCTDTFTLDLTINKIIVHPVGPALCATLNATTSVSVTTNVTSPVYTWQYRVVTATAPNPAWITVTSANAGSVYTDITTATLGIKRATSTLPALGTQYQVLISAGGCALTSDVAPLTIIPVATASTAIALTNTTISSAAVTAVGPYISTDTVFTLTATQNATATSYNWILPEGVNQLSGGSSNIITVNFAGVGTGTTALPISVQSVNACGVSALKTLSLTRALPARPGVIATTQTNVCLTAGSDTNVTYSVAPVVGAFTEGYTWTVPNGAAIVSGQGSTAIIVSYGSTFNVAGSVTVTSSNGVGTSLTAATLAITATAPSSVATLVMTNPLSTTPTTAITAVGPYMGTDTELTLTAGTVAGAVSYNWTLPVGVSQISGGDSNIITVSFADVVTPTGIATLVFSVKAVNGCGLSSATAKTLSLTRALPARPGVIATTQTNVCLTAGSDTNVTYSVAPVIGAFTEGYTWTVPNGAAIVSGQGSTAIVVSYASNYTTGNVMVTSSNGVGTSSTAATLAVTRRSSVANPTALTTGQVAGLCSETIYNYSFDAGVGATSYVITAPVGSFVNGTGSNTATTTDLSFSVAYPFGFSTGTIGILASNACISATSTRTFLVSKALASITTITGVTTVNSCDTFDYQASTVAGATEYIWTVPTGAVIVGGQGTGKISVTFPGLLPTTASLAVIKVVATNPCGTISTLKSSGTLTRFVCETKQAIVEEEAVPTSATFAVFAYPNPSASTFKLSLTTSSNDKVVVVVYDMAGRMIEKRELSPSEASGLRVGDRYPSGVYNIVVTQGEQTKTVRVVKN